jgi:hypothetical protein
MNFLASLVNTMPTHLAQLLEREVANLSRGKDD